jgi:hypothetical protein
MSRQLAINNTESRQKFVALVDALAAQGDDRFVAIQHQLE